MKYIYNDEHYTRFHSTNHNTSLGKAPTEMRGVIVTLENPIYMRLQSSQ